MCYGTFERCRSLCNHWYFPETDNLVCTGYGKSHPASLMWKMIPQQRCYGACLIWRTIGQPCSRAATCKTLWMYTERLDRCERLAVEEGPYSEWLLKGWCNQVGAIHGRYPASTFCELLGYQNAEALLHASNSCILRGTGFGVARRKCHGRNDRSVMALTEIGVRECSSSALWTTKKPWENGNPPGKIRQSLTADEMRR